ncbi:NAD(P)/FAD-dependent oxidoreductase [Ideonella sp. 4Y11]|uniref:NAD(P)/FAD-dependent oxidoreductase n=1 Tax=Ideonella aquatica TaxID=2824119 RepID=A0A940YR76_9BURK|nr:NAD(P)/FAD-dependent oxidoreductase [Ideonella aquatica]MBQ0957955.1 NAD(P)/FAD-dependent oxidoreductase [Ideonella aquatica]
MSAADLPQASASRRHRDRLAASYDVVVVGAGVGGLTSAALLAEAGARVLVVERQPVLGGFCHSWYRKVRHQGEMKRFRFDAGAMDFSGAHPGGTIRAVLQRVGADDKVRWRPLEHTYRQGRLSLDVPHDWREWQDTLCGQFPEEAEGIRGFFDAMRLVADARHSLAPHNGGVPRQPRGEAELRSFAERHAFAHQWKDRPVTELLARHVTRPQVAALLLRLSHYLTENRDTLSVARAADLFRFYFVGGYYPEGGTGRLPDALAEAVEERGGTVLSNASVERIMLRAGRVCGVRLDDGREIAAAVVISNADIRRTFGELLEPGAVSPEVARALAAMKPTPSGFTVYLAVDFVPQRLRSYTVDANYAFHVPSLVDPGAAPAGCSVFEVRTIFSDTANWFPADAEHDDWRATPAYAVRKRRFGDWLLRQAAQVVPELHEHVLYRTDASPLTYARYGHSIGGALYGWSGRPEGFDNGRTSVPGLYLVGSSALGSGIETVMISGANAAESLVPGLLADAARFTPPVTPPRELALAAN